MAERRVAARNPSERERDDLSIECADNAVEWSDPSCLAGGSPPHGFGPGQFRDGFGKHLTQDNGRVTAFSRNHRDVELAFTVVAGLAFFARHARRAKKSI